MQAVEMEWDNIQRERILNEMPGRVDLIIEIDSEPEYPLSAQDIHKLTTGSQITLLQARPLRNEDGKEFTRVLLHVPYGQLPALAEKFKKYGEELTEFGNIPNSWVANVRRIARAALQSLWTDSEPMPADDTVHWWQFWIRRNPPPNVQAFETWAAQVGLTLRPEKLKLPEHIIMVGSGTLQQLAGSLNLLNTLAEIRAARPWHYELSHLSGDEQHEWITLAIERMIPPAEDAPAVCILDSGINRGHPLLAPVLAEGDNHTIFPDGDSSDSEHGSGHGTLMAGLAAYSDLRSLMLEGGDWNQMHRLEGVKLIDPNVPHEPQNYGAVTVQAVNIPDIGASNRKRVYVMAVTATGDILGQPSAWSAAMDNCAFGAEEEGEPKRLIIVSAGNVDALALDADYEYTATNLTSQIEDPAQAWNVVTVGAVTRRGHVLETDPESSLLTPIAPSGELSPLSRTSCKWQAHWPIKPEIVMEGGNVARAPDGSVERRDSLDLLSTSADFRIRPLAPFRATSAASALAAHMAASILAAYPHLKPETVRGLLVHSARWSDTMLAGLNPHRAFTRQTREQFNQLLRCYGYGEPDASRASHSSEQEVTLLREDELTPYKGSAGGASLNECHVHRLMLPAGLLRDLGHPTCTMRVTLSYFTAPNPSASNRIPGSRYRYGGALLRFRVRHKDESEEVFMQHVSAEANEDDDEAEEGAEPESLNDRAWALGPKLRGKGGSLIQDVWQGNAADLASMNLIAVYPVKGWWASRSFPRDSPWHRCHKKPLPYSLIVSVEVSADIPLYTEIQTLISAPLDAA
ncbi:MAG: hypothetical protein B7Z37_27950 [Verrucomicrobia bacterium 12-59-8]|nr:MAG: hypothetical protein B7Z37_27950 [Verrucomicrobia bacterium 12-59-8]